MAPFSTGKETSQCARRTKWMFLNTKVEKFWHVLCQKQYVNVKYLKMSLEIEEQYINVTS